MTITDVTNQPAGTIIKSVKGALVGVGPYEKHNRPDGEAYTSQTFTLCDGIKRIDGIIFDHYEIDPYLDKQIILCSLKSRNGRFGGLTVTKFQPSGSIFGGRRPAEISKLRVTKAGGLHTPETWTSLKREE